MRNKAAISLFSISLICTFFLGILLGNELCKRFIPTVSVPTNASNIVVNKTAPVNTNINSKPSSDEGNPKAIPDANTNTNTNTASIPSNNSSKDTANSSNYKPGDLDKFITANKGSEKIAYLTFDDGPTYTTSEILDILDKYKIKATFFVVGSMCRSYPSILRREYNDNQFICNHTYSHDYKYIYSSPQNFVTDVQKCEKEVQTILGIQYKTWLVRFPGGSEYNDYLPKDNSTYTNALIKAGYSYVNWNALTGDAESQNIAVQTLINNVKKGIGGKKSVVILMHDCTEENTVSALPQIIEYLKAKGYQFRTLNDLKKSL